MFFSHCGYDWQLVVAAVLRCADTEDRATTPVQWTRSSVSAQAVSQDRYVIPVCSFVVLHFNYSLLVIVLATV